MWYTLQGPVTYVLQPGLINDTKFAAIYKTGSRRVEGESLPNTTKRVMDELIAYYMRPRRGFTYCVTKENAAAPGFPTLGRTVTAQEAVRTATDTVCEHWTQRDATPLKRPRKSPPRKKAPSEANGRKRNRDAVEDDEDEEDESPANNRAKRRRGADDEDDEGTAEAGATAAAEVA